MRNIESFLITIYLNVKNFIIFFKLINVFHDLINNDNIVDI